MNRATVRSRTVPVSLAPGAMGGGERAGKGEEGRRQGQGAAEWSAETLP